MKPGGKIKMAKLEKAKDAKAVDNGKGFIDLNKPIIETKMRLSKDGKKLITTLQFVIIKPVTYLEKVLSGPQ